MFNPLMAQVVEHHFFKGDITPERGVVEFGNQRLDPNHGVALASTAETTEQFYKCLGFSKYLAIDVNTKMGAVALDLNRSLFYQGLKDQFNLVTNNGTGEHIFDQRWVFENAHDLCTLGACMLHVLPFGWWVNHGFYNYNPIIFDALAKANNYDLIALYIGERWGMRVKVGASAFEEKNPMDLLRVVSGFHAQDLSIVALMRKTSNLPFSIPLQTKYIKDIGKTFVDTSYFYNKPPHKDEPYDPKIHQIVIR